jgi:hypothetical protein
MRGHSPAAAHASAAETAVRARIATLTVTAPPADAGRSVTVAPGGTVVGRGLDADLSVGSEHLSRRHFAVRQRAGAYEVEDLGSRNGTLLNGAALTGSRVLRAGDRLSAGGVEVEFGLDRPVELPPRRSAPAGGSWRPDEDTRTSGPPPARAEQPSLGRELHAAASFSGHGLLLAVLGSVVGTVLGGAASAGPWGTLAGAAVTPVVSTAFATRRAGDRGRVAAAAIVLLSAGALVITVTGVSLADLATGTSVLPGNGDPGTFPGVNAGATPRSDPSDTRPSGRADADPVDCGSAAVGSTVPCPGAVLVFTGRGGLKITSVEVVGDAAGDFVPGTECVGRTIGSGSSCETRITFTPSAAGPRRATLIIHQRLPLPDHGTHVDLTGAGEPPPADPATCPADPAATDCVTPGP